MLGGGVTCCFDRSALAVASESSALRILRSLRSS